MCGYIRDCILHTSSGCAYRVSISYIALPDGLYYYYIYNQYQYISFGYCRLLYSCYIERERKKDAQHSLCSLQWQAQALYRPMLLKFVRSFYVCRTAQNATYSPASFPASCAFVIELYFFVFTRGSSSLKCLYMRYGSPPFFYMGQIALLRVCVCRQASGYWRTTTLFDWVLSGAFISFLSLSNSNLFGRGFVCV